MLLDRVLVRWRSLRFAPVDLFYSIALWIRLPLVRYANGWWDRSLLIKQYGVGIANRVFYN
jgi:hypothetical protein